MTRSEHFRHWLNESVAVPSGEKPRRKLVSLARWCNEVAYDPGNFNRFLSGKMDLPEPHLSNMIMVCMGFGYEPLTSDRQFL